MPQIPQYLSREQLPGTSGVRGGLANVPVVPEPGVQDPGPSALEKSLGAIPEAITQAGELQVRTEALQAARTKGQDLLDAQTRRQDVRPQLGTLFDKLKQGPYQTLPEDFLQQGNDLIAQQGQSLGPQARAIFTEKAKEDLAMLHGHALAERTQRRDNATVLSAMTEVNWVVSQYHQAGSDAERLYLKDNLQGLLTSLVDRDLMKGEVAAKMMVETEKGLQVEQARATLRVDPGTALRNIATRLNGGTADDAAIQRVSPTMLPDLFDEATKQLEHRVTIQEHESNRQKRAVQAQQKLVEAQHAATIYKAGVTTNELAQTEAQLRQDLDTQRVSEEGFVHMSGHIQTLTQKLHEDIYKDRSLPEVANQAWTRIYSAQTPGDLDIAEHWLQSNRQNLSSGTVREMFDKLTTLRDRDNPLNDDYAKEAKRVFLEGAFPGGIIPAVMDKIDGGTHAKISQGLNLLYDELKRVYDTEGRGAMQQQAVGIGRRLLETYFPQGATTPGRAPAGLPPVFQGTKTFDDGLLALDAMKELSPEQRRKYYLILKESLPRKPLFSGEGALSTLPSGPSVPLKGAK